VWKTTRTLIQQQKKTEESHWHVCSLQQTLYKEDCEDEEEGRHDIYVNVEKKKSRVTPNNLADVLQRNEIKSNKYWD
jgi:hypothetical protein